MKLIGIILFIVMIQTCQAQVEIVYTKGKKSVYMNGDIVNLSIKVTTDTKICLDGTKQIKLFASGLTIKEQTQWKELKKGLWQKDVICLIESNKKGFAQLTVMRKVDKQSFVFQEKFDLK